MEGPWSFIILGIVEGLTEFLPVSSSGHLIVARSFFGLTTGNDLAVDATLQLATALALIVYFWRDLLNLAYTALYLVVQKPVRDEDRRLLVAIVIGTIPVIILGLLLEQYMETVFRSATLVAYTLIAGSVIMVAAEWFTKFVPRKSAASFSWMHGLGVGLFQCIALVPGMSRSGMTIAGGMFMGFTRADAARFGFLLSVPILVGSGLKKLYDLSAVGAGGIELSLLFGCIAAFVTGLLAISVLMALVRSVSLTYFAVYRVFLALTILLWLS